MLIVLHFLCLFMHGLLDSLALPLHHFLEDPDFLVEILALRLEGLYLLVVQLIPHEYFIVKSSGFFPLITADVLRILFGEFHCAVQSIHHPYSYLLLLFLDFLLRLELVPQRRAVFLPNR